MGDFLLVFQRQCPAMKPHKFYHECFRTKQVSKFGQENVLHRDFATVIADCNSPFGPQHYKFLNDSAGLWLFVVVLVLAA